MPVYFFSSMVVMCHNIHLIEMNLGNSGVWCRIYVLRGYHCDFYWFVVMCACFGYIGGDI